VDPRNIATVAEWAPPTSCSDVRRFAGLANCYRKFVLPFLRVWDPARPPRLHADASELAVSAILEQPDDAGVFRPVAFESRKLTQAERLYRPHRLQLLAVVHALKTLRPYPLNKPFELHTDNASLQWLQAQRHIRVSRHQARWRNLLA
jgi:hypothetical protein